MSGPLASAIPPPQPWRPTRAVKIAISTLLLVHLTALVVSPWSIERSPMAGRVWELLEPYVKIAYLNHGYHFFAPQPGPSHLLRYDLELADGRHVTGEIPSRKDNRPRLFYHRHFMLTEFLNMLYTSSTEIKDPKARERQTFEAYCNSYAEHLAHKYDARRVTMRLIRHQIPFPDEVARGQKLNDPRLYEELFQRSYVMGQL